MQQQPITITIGGPKDGDSSPASLAPFPSEAFAGIAPEFDSRSEKPQFVVGVDSGGIVRRLVSQPTTERHVVAALVGTWVAAGLRVQHVEGFVALAKLIRKAAGAEKESEGADKDLVAAEQPSDPKRAIPQEPNPIDPSPIEDEQRQQDMAALDAFL